MSKLKNHIIRCVLYGGAFAAMASCSTTGKLADGEHLYIGLDHIRFENYESNDQATFTKEEVEAVLECPPNGALFGSSYHRTPLPYGLWVWNAFSDSKSGFGKWINKSFGKAPVTISSVNPELRASVANSTLHSHGYLRGFVKHDIVETRSPKKRRIGYDVNMGHLFRLDSVAYMNFTASTDSLMAATVDERLLKRGEPFDAGVLDEERTRLTRLFKNNGYYFYQPAYISYFADTVAVPGKVQLRVVQADSLPEEAYKKWYIGNIDITLRKTMFERPDTQQTRRRFTVHYKGRRMPLRYGVLAKGLRLRKGQPYSYDDYLASISALNGKGVFSSVDCRFTPRNNVSANRTDSAALLSSGIDSVPANDTLDVRINCVFDKPYDVYIEANVTGKTNGFLGPGIVLGVSKKNALRGGEVIDVNIHGNYEWQTRHATELNFSGIHSYEYGADISLEVPRLVTPWRIRRFRRFTPSTTIKASFNAVNRANYFRRHIVSGEWTYKFQSSQNTRHQFSPLIFEYNYMGSYSEEFGELIVLMPYLLVSMMDQFVPKMRYVFTYSSPLTHRNPIFWETSVSEAGNLLALGYSIAGKPWHKKDKRLFNNPFAQFVRLETDFRKSWSVGEHSHLVAHVGAGIIFSYGNASYSPYTEQFYVGGANSVRAFTVRSIGPGKYHSADKRYAFLDQTGDVKLQFNLEYRTRLFGNLNGAVFLDAGNVWTTHTETYREGSKFDFSKMFNQLAVGTGIGLRYDLDFFVVRLDWGIGLHVPYDTGKKGYFNIPKFKDGQSIHFAIGYPF